MSPGTLDLNADCGESYGNWQLGSDEILDHVTSANVAAGFHAGDPVTLVATVEAAVERGVGVGVHPGLPDLLGFGRRRMDISPEDAYAYFVYQAGAVAAALRRHGATLHHVKPHGAMYLILRDNEDLAEAATRAICEVMDEPVLYWPDLTEWAHLPRLARAAGVRVLTEIYPDLSYDADGGLVVERAKHSTPVDAARERVRAYLEDGVVRALDGSLLPIQAESICVHGDGPNAIEVVQAVREECEKQGVRLSSTIEPQEGGQG
ncbi:MAG: 5-oxoprolinase subunit PxpA [Microvirga sp.]